MRPAKRRRPPATSAEIHAALARFLRRGGVIRKLPDEPTPWRPLTEGAIGLLAPYESIPLDTPRHQ